MMIERRDAREAGGEQGAGQGEGEFGGLKISYLALSGLLSIHLKVPFKIKFIRITTAGIKISKIPPKPKIESVKTERIKYATKLLRIMPISDSFFLKKLIPALQN